MRLSLQYAPHLILAGCVVATAGLLAWPAPPAAVPSAPVAQAYAGPVLEVRRVSPDPRFPLRLQSRFASSDPAPATEPAPILVGVAGGLAYLRSSTTGEVESLALGGEIDGWTLASVAPRAVTLRGASGERRLELFARIAESAPTRVDPSPAAARAAEPMPETIP